MDEESIEPFCSPSLRDNSMVGEAGPSVMPGLGFQKDIRMAENSETTDRLIRLVQNHAMLALEKSSPEREEYLEMTKTETFADAKVAGFSDQDASDFAARLDEWIRAAIKIIEKSGDAEGGEA